MATTPHAAHTRANMYGLARHAKHYERWAGLLATPLYRRVVADVAAAPLGRRGPPCSTWAPAPGGCR